MDKSEDIIWIEKYRPKKLNDVVGHPLVIKRLKKYVENKNIPHLLFGGYRGTGKTTLAIILAREIFGEQWQANFKELNSSNERGINVVREQIKQFASTTSIGDVPFKILLLDECDGLTFDAQAALRRIMEQYNASCKFILSCNYTSKIIEPIQSRCAIYRFGRLSNDDIKKRLLYICSKENLVIDNDALDAICYVSEGDLRCAINNLETASLMGNDIKVDSIYKSSGLVHPNVIIDFLKGSLEGNFQKSMIILDNMMFDLGLTANDILHQMFKEVMNLNIQDKLKVDIIDKVGDADFRISEGANELIQMKWLIVNLMKIGK